MNLTATKAWIEGWEGGRHHHVYPDSAQHPTIGIGFNLDKAGARQRIEALGLNFDAVRAGTQDLTDPQIDTLFNDDVNQAISDARSLINNFDTLPDDKQMVVTDMAFNMGRGALANFVNFIDALEHNDWNRAANEMVNSLWYTQVGSGPTQRGGTDANLMRSAGPPSAPPLGPPAMPPPDPIAHPEPLEPPNTIVYPVPDHPAAPAPSEENPAPPEENPAPPEEHPGPPEEHPAPPEEHPAPPEEHPAPPEEHPGPPEEHPDHEDHPDHPGPD